MIRPVWLDYAVWDYSDRMYPKLIGLREDAPDEIRKAFKEHQKWLEKTRHDGYDY